MIELGKIEKIDNLHAVWKHEARDFSKWLSDEESLAMLSEATGVNNILFDETESPVGNFYVDLYATEEDTNKKIIIENQLGDTNHDHLGKIITYASGKDANIIIWIVKHARDEHKHAIEWLNQHTDENIDFFLIEIELWKIGNSLPAPKFNVVERPNEWVTGIKELKGLTKTKKLQLEFWKAFKEYAFSKPEFKKVFSPRKPQAQYWYDLSTGVASLNISLTVNTQKNFLRASIYIHDDKEMFERFRLHKDELENELSGKVEWRVANKDCRIFLTLNDNIKKKTLG